MKIDKKVEICIIVLFILFIVLFFSLVSLIAFLSFMIVRCSLGYLGIKTVFILVIMTTIFYFLVRTYKRLVSYERTERLRRFRIFWRFYMELRNEAYIRGTRRRKEQAERARQIRRQDDREFKQRMTRLVEEGKALGEKREQCVQEYKQTLKTKEESRKKPKEENGNSTNLKNDHTLSPIVPLLAERKENMEKIIQRRNEEREKNSTGKKENNPSISQEVNIPNLPCIRATLFSFIVGVKRMDQTCRSYKGPKRYYMLYNVDYAIINVLFAIKELLNTNGASCGSLSIGLRSSHEITGLGKSSTILGQDMRPEQQGKPSSSTDIQSLEEEIDHLMSAAHSRILFVRNRALKSIDYLLERKQTNTLATRLAKLDVQQIQSCFKQDDVIEAFDDLHDVILPRFRKCINTKMESDKMNMTNMDHWERRFDENMTKVQKRQSLTHLKVGNGYARTILTENPLKEKDSLERTQSLWCYVQGDLAEKRKRKWIWLESLRRSNKDNSVTYLAVGGAAVIAVTSYAVYRYLR